MVTFHSKLLVSQRVNPMNLYKSILVGYINPINPPFSKTSCGICGYWAEFEILLTFFRPFGSQASGKYYFEVHLIEGDAADPT